MRFTYTCNHRPFDGLVLKRGIGKGGFGEVYFGLSEGGKEMALKLIRSHQAVELRGIRHCLNLQHPNLVHLYDLRADAQGDHWLIMEYVPGGALSQVIARHPKGLTADLACQWFQDLAEGIHFLHDHGIVHRDLKPANLFLDRGLVKVGDYGLCKVLNTQNPGTSGIGTVHYTAPEVSQGNYNRQIDIYAAGVILYELLTGKVPFDGDSQAEILMKHLTAHPDMTQVPAAFQPILRKALDKDPTKRYSGIQEMSKDVERVTPRTNLPVMIQQPRNRVVNLRVVVNQNNQNSPSAATVVPALPAPGPNWREISGSLAGAGLWALLLTLLWGIVSQPQHWGTAAQIFLLTVACSWGVLVPSFRWRSSTSDSPRRRLVYLGVGLAVGMLAVWLDGYAFAGHAEVSPWEPLPTAADEKRHPFYGAIHPNNHLLPVAACYLSYFGLMFLGLRWWRLAEVSRRERLNLRAVVTIAFWAYVLLILLPSGAERQVGFVAFTMSALVVQLSRRWETPAPPPPRRVRLQMAQ